MKRKDGKPRKDCKIAKCWKQVLIDYNNGMTLKQLSKKYNIDDSNICRFFKTRGIKLRSHSEADKLAYKTGRKKVLKGDKNPSWNGGQTEHTEGYVLIKMPEHHRANNRGYVKRADIIAEQMLGRLLYDNEIVHHKNRNKKDDRPCNLEVMILNNHSKMHGLEGASKRWYGDKNYLTNKRKSLCKSQL